MLLRGRKVACGFLPSSLSLTMGLATRDLTVLLVATVIALASFHWESAFDFVPGSPVPLRTVAGPSEFTNMYVPQFPSSPNFHIPI